jgi:hypothetical protein
MNPKNLARAGLASLPLTAFAPVAGVALTGHGMPWVVAPVGSVVAAVVGIRAERRAASTRRRGLIVADPDLNGLRETLAAPRDLITVDYRWSDEAA